MGDGYMCGRNVKMKESLSHFCGISFLPKWDFFFCGLHTDGKLSVTVYFFIDNGEQCILNGRSGFPYLVQESNGGRRQITIDNTLIRIFVFQFGNGDRTEYFVRRTES